METSASGPCKGVFNNEVSLFRDKTRFHSRRSHFGFTFKAMNVVILSCLKKILQISIYFLSDAHLYVWVIIWFQSRFCHINIFIILVPFLHVDYLSVRVIIWFQSCLCHLNIFIILVPFLHIDCFPQFAYCLDSELALLS